MFDAQQRALWFAAQNALFGERAADTGSAAPPTWVIIDMLDDFPASRTIKDAVIGELGKAMAAGADIVFVESRGKCSTHSELVATVADYDRKVFTHKSMNDGSCSVVESCLNRRFRMRQFRVCGVNTNFCVYETVAGLLLLVPDCQIEVCKHACNQELALSDWTLFRDKRITVTD